MKRIVFVCTGNTCRSPMAEKIFQHVTNGYEVRSRGLFAMDGAPAAEHAVVVLGEAGIPASHVSKALSEEDMVWATHVIGMTADHVALLQAHYPHMSDKLYTLKGAVGEAGSVSDPYGGSIDTYRQTFAELERLLQKLAVKLDKA
ncbi:low molecular weight protein arginine phosphatase [Bacillus fonticola]|uniref:low molecular weight protein arginine phosphatase n=1 Tax=Bacillus fonticola TaxID=2728853 RepID=UPI0014730858|nr:low molecular weight protein arginine phosphatase [Bacillus fonticola]